MRKVLILCIFTLLFVCALNHNAFAISVLADYTYTGSPGDYLLNFRFTNNIPANYYQYVYYVTVDLPGLQGIPNGWYDGSYGNSAWGTYYWPYPYYSIFSGQSLSGFTVHTSAIPETIHYTATALDWYGGGFYGPGYYGDDAYIKGHYPSFAGEIAGLVPEPATLSLLGLGLLGLLGLKKKRG